MLPTSAALSSGGLRPWLLVGPIASQLQQVGRQEATGRGVSPGHFVGQPPVLQAGAGAPPGHWDCGLRSGPALSL